MSGRVFAAALLALVPLAAGAQTVAPATTPLDALRTLTTRVSGRVEGDRHSGWTRQWPGTYFETAFRGTSVYWRVGPGEVSLRVRVDGGAPIAQVRPAPGLYAITGLVPGPHRLRIDVASESQAAPTVFGGFLAPRGETPLTPPPRAHQIEVIGDSHTVGYGNTSSTTQCSRDEIWRTTDTTLGLAPLTAARYGADYQVNAISGRGVVRNYGGFAADTLPQAYPFVLFDHARRAADRGWHPQVIVIGLGTNDFTTPLHAGERWSTREALHADYEATYLRFVRELRARAPWALIVLWATDLANGEIEAEAARVVDRLRADGDQRVGFVPVNGLSFAGCNSHPTTADDARVAAALSAFIDAHPGVWR